MTAQRRDWARIQDRNPHQLSTARLSILQQKHLVAARCPSLSIELIANVRTVEAHSPTLVSMDDAVLGTSRTAELRKSICRCVHGADCRRAVTVKEPAARDLWITRPTFSSCQTLSTKFGAEILTSRC